MAGFNRRTIGDIYTQQSTISVPPSPSGGGWYSVDANGGSVLAQLAYGETNLFSETDEQELFSGASGIIPRVATGIRFRNAVAGQNGIVTAWIAGTTEPALQVSAIGAPATSQMTVSGRIGSNGAVLGGVGFSVVHNGVGDYTITFSPAFTHIPAVVVSGVTVAGNNQRVAAIATATVSTVEVFTFTSTGNQADVPFSFVAVDPGS